MISHLSPEDLEYQRAVGPELYSISELVDQIHEGGRKYVGALNALWAAASNSRAIYREYDEIED
jgi:hypothetical protein